MARITQATCLHDEYVQIYWHLQGDRTEITFALGQARDIYMAASGNFVKETAMSGNTLIHSYASQDADQASQLALSSAVQALEIYSRRFRTYPFTNFTIILKESLPPFCWNPLQPMRWPISGFTAQ